MSTAPQDLPTHLALFRQRLENDPLRLPQTALIALQITCASLVVLMLSGVVR